jgi:XdhC and CoxI family
VGQEGTRERSPGEVSVGQESGQRALHERELARRPAQLTEALEQLVSAGGRVEVGGEPRDRAAVELELARGVAAGGEQEHGAADGPVQLVVRELELRSGDERERDETLGVAAGREHLLDREQDEPHGPQRYDQTMREVLADVERWRARGERVAIATVVAARRSAPRPIGSKLAVSERGEMAGSISGGCVEGDVAERAKDVLGGADPVLLTYGIADEQAFEVGLPCGGEIDVWLERLE